MKASIQQSNIAEQQTHQASLSLDKKACIQERNTAAHQKQREKFMTKEEQKIKAQIKEYAVSLPSTIDIDQLTVEFLRENFYKHPILALVYQHCCSVDPRASIWNDELETSIDSSATWDRISDLIEDPIGQKEAVLCQQTFKTLD